MSFLCGQYLSANKCDFRPTCPQKYLGMVCDSDTIIVRIPQGKLNKLQQLLRETIPTGHLSFRKLQQIASTTVMIRPASLSTHAMFAAVADLKHSGLCSIDLTHDSRADLVGELKQCLSITATSQEGPRERALYFGTALTNGSSHVSSVAWGA